jgi:hypothetical protein
MVHLQIKFQQFGLGNCSKLLKLCSLETDQIPADTPTEKLLLNARSISPDPLQPGFSELWENG